MVAWAACRLDELYRDGVCGGALLGLAAGGVARQVLVPLAHQSALAGVLLAVQLIAAAHPKLRWLRPDAIEGRYDVLAGLHQVLAHPRRPARGCLCADLDFRAAYRTAWPRPARQDGGWAGG